MRAKISVTISAILLALLSPIQMQAANAANGDLDTSLSLSGTSQYADVANVSELNSFNALSIEAWIKPTVATANIVAKAGAYALYTNVNTLSYAIGGTSTSWSGVSTNITINTNEWHHVALTRASNTNQVKIYLDGNLRYAGTADSAGTGAVATNTNSISVGARSGAATYFAGSIDEVRISNVERSANDIKWDMYNYGIGSESGVVAYYDFNDVSGTTIVNKTTSPAANTNLTLYGSPTLVSAETTSNVGGNTTVTFIRPYLTANGGFKIASTAQTLQVLVVGGGGGGGFDGGGGGGGGGVYQSSNQSFTPGNFYQIIVGMGGHGGPSYQGGTYCTGAWTTTILGCQGASGGLSRFGSITASGGGGGGGIEAPGLNDSDASATVRGGGGGAGSQNSLAGTPSASSGGASGGTVTDVNQNAGAGGASPISAGGNSTSTTGGTGATGVIGTLTGFTYGSGGGGGSYAGISATAADGAGKGGTNAADSIAPTANRGGGGGGSGVGGRGYAASTGAAGVIILKWNNLATASIAPIGNVTYRAITSLSLSTNTDSKVTFKANGKNIAGCVSLRTNNLIASCNWKPSVHATVTITATVVPIDTSYAQFELMQKTSPPTKRTTTR